MIGAGAERSLGPRRCLPAFAGGLTAFDISTACVFDFRNNQFPFVINRRRGATELFESLDGGIAHVHYSFAWAATYGRMAHIFEPRTRQTPGL